MRRRLRAITDEGDAGFGLVELLMSVVLFTLLVGMVANTITSQSRAGDDIRQLSDVSEEARVSLVRMSRELREATAITAATRFASGPAAAAGHVSALSFTADFNGSGGIEPDAVDPEALTYRYVPAADGDGQIQLTADDGSGSPLVRPILSAHVSDFRFELQSSNWQCDSNGDGVTTWQELDTDPRTTGTVCPNTNRNGQLDANELRQIDSVRVVFTVFNGRHQRTFSTQANLRNIGVGATS